MAEMRVCPLSDVPTSMPLTGTDACRPGRPLRMTVDKCKLHYVVHYMYSGMWDELVPEENQETLGLIEAYHCKMCPRRFRNNHDKKSYPGRGSIICHLATEHGQLLKQMRSDDKVDMTAEIEAINKHENGKFLEIGIPDVPDNELYIAKESFMWKIQNGKLNCDKGDNSKNRSNNNGRPSNNEMPNIVPRSKTELGATANGNDPPRPKPKLQECPHCDEYKNNMDASKLRLHILLHYRDRWEGRLDHLEAGQNCFWCDLCPKRKQLKGANQEGARNSAICHFAIQHHELRDVLKRNDSLPPNFIDDLYFDIDLKEGRISEGKPREEPAPSEQKPPAPSEQKPKQTIKKDETPMPTRGRRSKSKSKDQNWISSDEEENEEVVDDPPTAPKVARNAAAKRRRS